MFQFHIEISQLIGILNVVHETTSLQLNRISIFMHPNGVVIQAYYHHINLICFINTFVEMALSTKVRKLGHHEPLCTLGTCIGMLLYFDFHALLAIISIFYAKLIVSQVEICGKNSTNMRITKRPTRYVHDHTCAPNALMDSIKP